MNDPVRILVVQVDERWKVTCAHCDRAWEWDFQSQATRSARAHVGSLPAGRVAQILVQRHGGAPEANWTHGQDGFPPEG